MASLRKTLALRLSRIAKASSSPASAAAAVDATASATPSSSLLRRFLSGANAAGANAAGANAAGANAAGADRRFSFLQKRPIFQPALPPDRFALPAGDLLAERIRALNPPRIRLDGLLPPPPAEAEAPEMEGARMKAEEVRKVARAARMEAARAALKATGESCITHAEFLRVCREAAGGDRGPEIARALDESGSVIVLGDSVFLRPEELVRAMERVIPVSLSRRNDPHREELRKMEEEKADIDRRAALQVRRELWGGLGYLVVQTAAFMRLTFWELSWDVMEPICFYVTSVYFMAGYAFFLRTAKEPSFEGFFQSRFATKQKRLMQAQGFDLRRFNELKQAYPNAPAVVTAALPHREFLSSEPSYPNWAGREL